MSKRDIKCVQCASQTKEATDITLITAVEGRRVLGIPEEIDRALGKKENVDIWLEDDKIVAEVY